MSQWKSVTNGSIPLLEQLVDEPVVEVQARLVHPAATLREDARPRDREAERVEAELAHQPDVVAVAMVEVARDLAGVAVAHLPGCRGEAVPHALAAAVLVAAPSIWYAAVAAPQTEVGRGTRVGRWPFRVPLGSDGDGAVTWQRAAWAGPRLDELAA